MSGPRAAAYLAAIVAAVSYVSVARVPPEQPKQKTEVVKQQPKVNVPQPRPKPKIVKEKEKKKAKAKPKNRGETFCQRVRREYERMSWAERWAAYKRATPQQVAAGRRCLGM